MSDPIGSPPLGLTVADRLDLHELAARYGNVIDARDWTRLSTVFSVDATFEVSGFGSSDVRLTGLETITAMLAASSSHPVAHHVTNVETIVDGETVRLFFKVLGPGRSGRVGSADYTDIVRRDADGWRIVSHLATRRRPR
ncbi:MAG: hypothetical protein JWL72_3103 [Ilumatobacteraceae bacterium]|nr:hypothetical protein [Ilumatobacteraceae bacterium]MCU1389765.1 hypothetical protein [Ilumatobacteraceae bacterium]